MKIALPKFLLAMLAVVCIVSCNSNESMSVDESAMWISAYTPERIDVSSSIRIEVTDSLLMYIDTLRSLNKVFNFSPSIKGTARYSDNGRYVDFEPKAGALKQGKQYNCRVSLSRLTGIDSLKDLSFDFYVERREVKLTDVHVSIDPDNVEQVVVQGQIIFSTIPSEQSLNSSSLTCNHDGTHSVITETSNKQRYSFSISGIKRKKDDAKIKIKYEPIGEFASTKVEVVVPGLSEFKLLSAKQYDVAEPYIDLEFSAPLSIEQELEGLISIDQIEAIRIERQGTNVKLYYPVNGLTDIVVRVSELLRSNDGTTLNGEIEQSFEQKIIPPAVEVPISGTILPDGQNLTFPFHAVNLATVDVEVVKIYTDNIMTFLQDYDIDDKFCLRRVGRLIYKKTIRLDRDKSLNLHKWQKFSIDLKGLFKQERGAIYNIRLSFRKEYSLYNKVEPEKFDLLSGVTKKDKDIWDQTSSYISRYAYDYDWHDYNWQESDDPTKDSYYMSSECMAEYNVMASNIGLIAKRADGEQLWCSVSNIMTAKPMSGIKITAYNYQMRVIGYSYTNEQGLADLIADGNPFVVTASDGFSTTYLKINSGHELSTSRFDVGGKKIKQGIKGFIYGERGVWRPGDDIYLTIVVEDKHKALPQNHPVTMELYTPLEQLYDKQTLTQSVDGIYTVTIKTTEDVPTGCWNAKFKVGGQTFNHVVRIETIKPNRLKINITSPEILNSEARTNIGIESHWLTGPVAAGLKTNVEMSLYNNPNPFSQYRNYTFSNPLYSFSHAKHKVYTGMLDSLGKASCVFEIPATNQAPGMLQANIIARVMETAGDESIMYHSVRYSPYKSYVGIALGDKEYETDCDLGFPVVTVDAMGLPIDSSLRYKIYKLNWSWWWEGSAKELERYVQSTTAEVVASGTIYTKEGKGCVQFRIEYPEYGKYLVYVEDVTSGHATGGVMYIDWPDWRGHSDKSDPTAQTMLSFSLDKRNYEVGEYAMVYLPKSSNGQVLVSIENGSKVISRRWVRTSISKETLYRFLVTKEMAPNFYVHATLLQPHAQTINDLPIRTYGVEGADVIDRRTILHPIIDVPSEISPQQEFFVKVRELEGKPMSYTLAVVDEGLLDITSYKTPEPWKAMNQREALGVKTWDMYSDVIGAYTGKFTSILSIGGDEALRRAVGKEKRFNPVVKFFGPFTLKKGTKIHKIKLPMYEGNVRVMVVAAKDGAYGSVDKSVFVRSPLMLLSTMPRQLSCGDSFKMPINIFSTEDDIKEVDVSVRVEGPLSVVGNTKKHLTFETQGEKLICFDLTCDNIKNGNAKVIVTANGGGYFVTDTINVNVRNPLPEITISENVVLEEGGKHRFDFFRNGEDKALLTLATMPTIDFGGVFSFVENYKHYCTEQLSARAMYMLYARKFLEAEEANRAEKALPQILKVIASRQLPSGGFVYWPGYDNAHDWVTSMVGEVLIEARRQGFVVSNQTIDRWKEYQNSASRKYRHSIKKSTDLIQAYRLYTLALAGEQITAAMNKLRESKSISQQALLRLATTYVLIGRSDVATKLLEKFDNTPSINGSYENFWSPLRDKAMALESWLLIGEKSRAIALAQEITKDFSIMTCSTQEVAFVSVAMSRMNDIVGNKITEVLINEDGGKSKIIRDIKGAKSLSFKGTGKYIVVENIGKEDVAVMMTKQFKPSVGENVEPISKGVKIFVRYTDMSGKDITINKIKQGDEFMAHIEVEKADNNSNTMSLTYVIPSGWEIWNDRLVDVIADSNASYIDVRDECISWYFSLDTTKRKRFSVKLRATYAGKFILPPTVCEDMYNANCRAITSLSKTIVE